jgi:hypothetical protein
VKLMDVIKIVQIFVISTLKSYIGMNTGLRSLKYVMYL